MKGKKTGGRAKGTPNKATTDFKLAVTALLNGADIQAMFDAIPAEKQLDTLARLAEFAFARLARTEVTGKDGGPLTVTINKLPPTSAPDA